MPKPPLILLAPDSPAGAPAAAPVIPSVSTPPPAGLTVPASALSRGAIPDNKDMREIINKAKQTLPKTTQLPGVDNPSDPLKVKETAAPALPEFAAGKPVGEEAPAAAVAPAVKLKKEKKAAEVPAATAPAAPTKIKIAGKEYTEAEIEAVLAAKTQPVQAAPVAPKPVEAPKAQQTPEEVSAAENKWVEEFSALTQPDITDVQMDAILAGGPEAAQEMKKILSTNAAKAVLLARKSMYNEIAEPFQKLQETVQMLSSNHEQLTRIQTEQRFFKDNPDFIGHEDTVRDVAEYYAKNYAEQVAQMTIPDFFKHVAEQSSKIIDGEFRKWNKTAEPGAWKNFNKAPAAAPAETEPVVAPAPAAVVAPPAKPRILPPAANSPMAANGVGTPDWNKQVALSMRG